MKRPPRPSFKTRNGIQRIAKAFGYSCQGLRSAYIHEAAFRQELLLCLVATPIAFWLSNGWRQFLLLMASLFFILIVELLNSAVETLADAVQPDYHPLVGRAKDISSAAVLLSFVVALCVWAAVLIPNYF